MVGFTVIALFVANYYGFLTADQSNALVTLLVGLGFLTSADADTLNKMKLKMLLILAVLLVSGCSPKSYRLAEYAVKTGLDIAEDAGAFKPREWRFNQQFKGDTLFFYEGINQYLLLKQDTSYIIQLKPNRDNLQDTVLYYLKKRIEKQNEKDVGTRNREN